MAEVNIVLSPKSGIGKTFVSNLLMVLKRKRDHFKIVRCFDMDPINQSFSRVGGLIVTRLDVDADFRCVRDLFNDVLTEQSDTSFVIDVGSSICMSLISYLREAQLLKMLADHGHSVFVHVPIVGGYAFLESVHCLKCILETMHSSVVFIIYQNSYFGTITNEMLKGKLLLDINAIKPFADRIRDVFEIGIIGSNYYIKSPSIGGTFSYPPSFILRDSQLI